MIRYIGLQGHNTKQTESGNEHRFRCNCYIGVMAMIKQFLEFDAMVPDNFERLMILWWREDRNATEEDVLKWYYDEDFKLLASRIAGTRCRFKPDLGYKDERINGTLCFEKEDNDFFYTRKDTGSNMTF